MTKKNQALENFVDLQTAARLAGVNHETLRVQVRQGKIPAQKIGNQYLVHKKDLEGVRVRQYTPRET